MRKFLNHLLHSMQLLLLLITTPCLFLRGTELISYVQITRIMGADDDSPYDILGVNKNMSADNIKKRYTYR